MQSQLTQFMTFGAIGLGCWMVPEIIVLVGSVFIRMLRNASAVV